MYYKKFFGRKVQEGKEGKVLCSPGSDTDNTKTARVATILAGIVEAIRRTAVIRIVVP